MPEWVDNLYEETLQKWKEAGSDKSGFAIFYSPVKDNVKIALIGYNPGGTETPDMTNIKAPIQHEYTHEKYKLAEKVYKIFKSVDLVEELENSIKFNMIFFRSRKAADFKNQELVNYSEEKVLEILDKTQPKIIITEGFKTFDRLLQLKKGTETGQVTEGKRRILKIGRTSEGTIMLGMIHPSGARGISDTILQKLGASIREHLAQLL